ncbi:hypothetical protein RP20_CCG008169 [Aedes albopictus]|nr:hypothetical protein RP20_CCG008169 [Aedes albopictus]
MSIVLHLPPYDCECTPWNDRDGSPTRLASKRKRTTVTTSERPPRRQSTCERTHEA